MEELHGAVRKPASRLASAFFAFRHLDFVLLGAVLPLLAAGLVTMNSFVGESPFFERQLIWIAVGFGVFLAASFIDWRFLRRTDVLVFLFLATAGVLALLFFAGKVSKGAQSWFSFGWFAVQPSEFAKLVLIMVLAKYFSRRHIEIAHIRHILVSGAYAFALFALVLLQPDFGSAIVIFSLWLGMVLVSGISKKHLLAVCLAAIAAFSVLWVFVFQDYQKSRIVTFLHPLTDVRGAGYNAHQSTIAVGSGGLFGKGVGYGTQSRLKFLPEYQTDFIFAAFAEEWGFAGVLIFVVCYGLLVVRVLRNALRGATNFEVLLGLGIAIYLLVHFIIHVGMNVGLLPVTGITLPFVSYGGTHLLAEFLALGIIMGMGRYARTVHREVAYNEFLGLPGP